VNAPQRLWWSQAKSDHDVFVLLRRQGVAECHLLHYLQMTTEKIAKAYFWQKGRPPRKEHVAFVDFVKFLGSSGNGNDRKRIARVFGFQRFRSLQNLLRSLAGLARSLERLAPNLADDGPNAEYPWPHDRPTHAPCLVDFPLWEMLGTHGGRDMLHFIKTAVHRFPDYADL
jgi:hypothetical protein